MLNAIRGRRLPHLHVTTAQVRFHYKLNVTKIAQNERIRCTRTALFTWRTFKSHLLRKASAILEKLVSATGKPTIRCAAYHPFWVGKWVVVVVIHALYLHGLQGWRPFKQQTTVTYGCMSAGPNPGLPRLYAGPVCDAQCRWDRIYAACDAMQVMNLFYFYILFDWRLIRLIHGNL